MAEELVLQDRHDAVTLLTLNRPDKRNALSLALRDALSERIATLEADQETKVIVVTGAGKAFSAGFDLAEVGNRDPDFVRQSEQSSARYHGRLSNCALPVICAINGVAVAGGLDLAVMCDIRIASPQARFGHPEIRFGSGVLYAALKEIIGGGNARELALTGELIDADRALEIGLVNAVADDVVPTALDVAASVAEAPRPALERVKARIIAGIAPTARRDDSPPASDSFADAEVPEQFRRR